jgi:diguanylate cyclase (GGDEF)-like protein
LRDTSRKEDLCFRYGGEEFILMLLGTGLERAVEISERVRKAVESTPAQTRQLSIPITVSLGVTQAVPQDPDLLTIVDRADRALYLAKSGGRNRVAVQAI